MGSIKNRFRSGLLLLAVATGVSCNAAAETFAMIGTGNVGSALGQRFTQLGHSVVYGSRDPSRDSVQALVAATGGGATATTPAQAVVGADIVVLAVPWDTVEALVAELGDLSGKLIIDPTNPRVQAADGLYDPPLATSNTALVQAWAPDADVVKALTLIPAEFMLNPDATEVQYVLPMAGDSPAAKARVAALLESMGIEVVDFGKARHARLIEALYSASRNMRAQGTPSRITYVATP